MERLHQLQTGLDGVKPLTIQFRDTDTVAE